MLTSVQMNLCIWESLTVLHTLFLLLLLMQYFSIVSLYLPVLCQNIVLCKFLTIASVGFTCISFFFFSSRFTKNEVVYGNSRHIKRALLFLNSSVQKSNRIYKSDLERILLDIKKEG